MVQQDFSCDTAMLDALERSLSRQRLQRYSGAKRSDRHEMLEMYIWNANVCESMYFPMQTLEVVFRNTVRKRLRNHYNTDRWFEKTGFKINLGAHWDRKISQVTRELRDGRKNFDDHNVVQSMTLGFWCHLLSDSFHNELWSGDLRRWFPNISPEVGVDIVSKEMESFRTFRNKVSHHEAVFDIKPRPNAEFVRIIKLLRWMCPKTALFVEEQSNFYSVWGRRP